MRLELRPKRESRTTKEFDAEEFLRQEEENSKAEAEQLRRTEILMNEYSLPWNVDDGKPPFPGMELNPCAVRWEPANLEEFIPRVWRGVQEIQKCQAD